MNSNKKYWAELLGTFVLVLFGCGSAVFAGDKIGFLGISFAFGLSIVAMAYAIGPISGCHVNPAVSFAMLLNGRLSPKEFIGYVVAQLLGAIAGSGAMALLLSLQNRGTEAMGQNLFDNAGGVGGGFVAELLLTFVFVLVIVLATSAKRGAGALAGLVIGLTLTLIHILGIPFTGTSVNPARSVGPALFAGGAALSQLWLFIVAPLVGGGLAAFAGRALGSEEAVASEERAAAKRAA